MAKSVSVGPGEYRIRVIDQQFAEALAQLPAVVFEGAKAVGKTRTARRLAKTVWELDTEAQRAVALADPTVLLSGEPPVLIDEWQQVPDVWNRVRRAVDDGAAAGSYILTGSAVPAGTGLHSGAGRIVRIRMRPLSLVERGVSEPTVSLAALLRGDHPKIRGHSSCDLRRYVDEIVSSGFPGMRQYTGRALRAQLDGYVGHIIDRDFPELGYRVRKPAVLTRWMTAYAAATGTTTNYENIRDAATSDQGEKPAKSVVLPYKDILERIWVLDPVPAWLPTHSHLGKLAQPPKHHLVDPALATQLLGLDAAALIEGKDAGPAIPRDGTFLGDLFDSLVTQSVRVYAQHSEASVKHMRSAHGEHEADLIVERRDRRVVAIEIKLKQVPTDDDVKHLLWLQGQLGADLLDAVVITTGSEAYRRRDGVAVVAAALLGP